MEGTILSSRYLLGDEIGTGGMGSVYRATDLRTGGVVAVKIPHAFLARNPEYKRRLRREAQIAASLYSPRVVRVIDLDEHDGALYLVMEYVPGETLAELIRERGSFSLDETLSIGLEVARALDAAHQKGIVHRDLKPQNIKLVDGEVKVLDFGIAKSDLLAAVTSSSSIVGTPEYCAPERIDGTDDIRSDIYSLGVVMFQLKEGHLPFQALTPLALLKKHESEPPPPLTGPIPSGVQELLDRCLAKDPDDRFQTPAALIQAITALRQPTASIVPPTRPLEPVLDATTAPLAPTIAYPTGVAPARPAPATGRRSLWPWAALGAGIVVAALATVLLINQRNGSDSPAQTTVPNALDVPVSTVEPAGTPIRLAGTPSPARALVAVGERVPLTMGPVTILIGSQCPGVRVLLQLLSIETDSIGQTRVAYSVQAPRVEGVECEVVFPPDADCNCMMLRTLLPSGRNVDTRNSGGSGLSVRGADQIYGQPEQRGEWWFTNADLTGDLLTLIRYVRNSDTRVFEIPLLQR